MPTQLTLVRATRPDISLPRAVSMNGVLRTVLGRIRRAVRAWRAHRQADRDLKVLLAMPDDLLRDIGVSRDELLRANADRTPGMER